MRLNLPARFPFRLPESTEPDGGGWFYRYDERGPIPAVPGVTISNGLAWSPDNSTMYIADRPNWQIIALDYDIETGNARYPRQFAKLPVGG